MNPHSINMRNNGCEHFEGKAYGAQQPRHIQLYVAGASTAQHSHFNAQQGVTMQRIDYV